MAGVNPKMSRGQGISPWYFQKLAILHIVFAFNLVTTLRSTPKTKFFAPKFLHVKTLKIPKYTKHGMRPWLK